jgi:hypothetical protein
MRMRFLIAALCLASMALVSISLADDTSTGQILHSYEGNLTEKLLQNQVNFASLRDVFGIPGFAIAETTKFKAPKSGWKLNRVGILGYDGFNGTVASVPAQRVIALEVRDKNFNLLYRFADVQIPYTNFLLNITSPTMVTIELPSISVSDEFFVCFFDRGAVGVGFERPNATTNSSFLFNEAGNELVSASLPLSKNQTTQVNWIMSVVGS